MSTTGKKHNAGYRHRAASWSSCRQGIRVCNLRLKQSASLGTQHPNLLQESEVVLEVPVVGDPAVLDPQDVGGDEVHGLTLPLHALERAGEMPDEAQM